MPGRLDSRSTDDNWRTWVAWWVTAACGVLFIINFVEALASACSGRNDTIRMSTDGCIDVTARLRCKHGTGR